VDITRGAERRNESRYNRCCHDREHHNQEFEDRIRYLAFVLTIIQTIVAKHACRFHWAPPIEARLSRVSTKLVYQATPSLFSVDCVEQVGEAPSPP
jgi:hypothetical protein